MKIRPKTPNQLIAQHEDTSPEVRRQIEEANGDLSQVATSALAMYIQQIREARQKRERYFTEPIKSFTSAIPLKPEVERGMIDAYANRVVDVADTSNSTSETMRRQFPSGTFLFHGSTTGRIVKTLQSGYLMNAHALGNKSAREDNGGEEGVSWSIGDIEAIPSTRHHMAGFVASPEKILGETTQLAVPDKPAPYEVVQLSRNIDAKEYYDTYTQARLLEGMYDALCFLSDTDEPERADMLEGAIDLDVDEYVERDDKGDLQLTRAASRLMNEQGRAMLAKLWLEATHVDAINQATLEGAMDDLERRIMNLADDVEKYVNDANDVRIPVDKLTLVVPRKDIKAWMRVLVRCGTKPAHVITYDSTTVQLEDFVSRHRGDGRELARQLRGVIGETPDTITYQNLIGVDFTDEMRAVEYEHLIDAEYLGDTKRVEMNQGKLEVL